MKKIIKFILLKYKWCKKLKFHFSSSIYFSSTFEGLNAIGRNSIFKGNMGLGSYIANDSHIYGNIGRFCSIGPYCRIALGVHPYTYPFLSTSPCFYSGLKQNGESLYDKSILSEFRYADENGNFNLIGNDVWVGARVTLVNGGKIGDGAVILAGSVVTKDVPDYAIVGGVPAKIIKYRYEINDINFLRSHKWWNLNIDFIRKNKEIFLSFQKYKDYVLSCAN